MKKKQKKAPSKVKKNSAELSAIKKSDVPPEKPKETIGRKIYQYVMQLPD